MDLPLGGKKTLGSQCNVPEDLNLCNPVIRKRLLLDIHHKAFGFQVFIAKV